MKKYKQRKKGKKYRNIHKGQTVFVTIIEGGWTVGGQSKQRSHENNLSNRACSHINLGN